MKKTALAIILISALLFSGAEPLKMAQANFTPDFREQIDPIPGTIPPIITITSPKNHTTYSSSYLNLTIHVTEPETPTPLKSYIHVDYYLDGIVHYITGSVGQNYEVDYNIVLHINKSLPTATIPQESYSNDTRPIYLRDGNHSLKVKAYGEVEPGDNKVFFIDSTSTVFFTINSPASSPTPSPTQDYGLNLSSPQQIAVLPGVIAIVGIGLLAYYFKKRRRDKSS